MKNGWVGGVINTKFPKKGGGKEGQTKYTQLFFFFTPPAYPPNEKAKQKQNRTKTVTNVDIGTKTNFPV